MSSPAEKHAESEFDDLLGQLVDELAMTPPSQSAVALVADVEAETPKAHIESTNQLAADAAASAGVVSASPAQPDHTVKVVGIIAGSLTAVALAAIVVFGTRQEPETTVEAQDTSSEDAAAAARAAEAATAQRAASEKAQVQALAAAEAEREAEYVRVEAARLKAAAEAAKPKPKPKRKWKPKPKPKPKQPKPGSDFDAL